MIYDRKGREVNVLGGGILGDICKSIFSENLKCCIRSSPLLYYVIRGVLLKSCCRCSKQANSVARKQVS
jgi:hypothetical protein